MSLMKMLRDMWDTLWGEHVFRGVVTGTSGNLVTVKRTGQSAGDTQSYPRLVSYSSPTTSDEVIVLKVGKGWIVIGEVLR